MAGFYPFVAKSGAKDFATLIADRENDEGFAALGAAENIGRPSRTADFIEGLARIRGRRIARRAPGSKECRENLVVGPQKLKDFFSRKPVK